MDELRRRIEASVIASSGRGREVLESGPFAAIFDGTTDFMYLSYAVPQRPLGDAASLGSALARIAQEFARRSRRLRFEFTAELWPELPPALTALGLVCEGSYPKMMLRTGELRPATAPGVTVRLLAADEPESILLAHHAVGDAAFGIKREPGAAELRQFRASLAGPGHRAAIAMLEGRMAGIATLLSDEEIAELAGVGTEPSARRKGVASTLSSFLIGDFLAGGGEIVWLSAGDAVAEAVYARLGFRPFATHTAWSVPAADRA